MSRVKTLIKRVAGRAFWFYSRIFSPFNNKDLIIMYHRVLDKNLWGLYDSAMYVTADTLDMHIRQLGRFFDIVPVSEMLETSPGNKGRCALTFDDGWKDNYLYAYPILKKYKVPATIFLTANVINTDRNLWFHAIWQLANQSIREGKQTDLLDWCRNNLCDLHDKVINEETVNKLAASLKKIDATQIDSMINKIYTDLELELEEGTTMLNWSQISEMSANGVRIGSHGLSHYILTTIDEDARSREIHESRQLIEKQGIEVDPIFCYPNGNWDENTIENIKDAGHKGAVTTTIGINNRASHPYKLRRVGLHEDISSDPALLWFRLLQSRLSANN